MKKTTLILLLALPFMGKAQMGDKTKHMIASNLIHFTASEITYQFTDKPLLSHIVGTGVAFGAGIGKELLDKHKGGEFSMEDMKANAWGILVSNIMFAVRINIKSENKKAIELANLKFK